MRSGPTPTSSPSFSPTTSSATASCPTSTQPHGASPTTTTPSCVPSSWTGAPTPTPTTSPTSSCSAPPSSSAPSFKPEPHTRTLYLPASPAWYDFWTGTSQLGSRQITAEAPLDRLPLYIRAGSILPLGPEIEYTAENPNAPIELRIYPGADADFSLYEDEGDTYAYEKGAHTTHPHSLGRSHPNPHHRRPPGHLPQHARLSNLQRSPRHPKPRHRRIPHPHSRQIPNLQRNLHLHPPLTFRNSIAAAAVLSPQPRPNGAPSMPQSYRDMGGNEAFPGPAVVVAFAVVRSLNESRQKTSA